MAGASSCREQRSPSAKLLNAIRPVTEVPPSRNPTSIPVTRLLPVGTLLVLVVLWIGSLERVAKGIAVRLGYNSHFASASPQIPPVP